MLDNLTTKQKKIFVIIGLIVILGVTYFIYNKAEDKGKIEIDENILVTNNNTSEDVTHNEKAEEKIVIHITGAVKTPGIVKINEGGRIKDAIEEAGGLTEDADISKVNLAYVVEDGIKIKIPSSLDESSEEPLINDDCGENVTQENNNAEENNQGAININKATQTDLENLPGIGPSLATKIIEYRETNGKFSEISELKNVNGIGESKYNNIKDFVSVK